MTYLIQTRIAADPNIILRAAACATSIAVPDARYWAQENAMRLAVTPGWVEAYRDSAAEEPGADDGAVTDAMILEAVRALWEAEQTPPPEPEHDTKDPA